MKIDMAIRTSRLLICVDTDRTEPTHEVPLPGAASTTVLARRARILNVDTLAVLGESSWLTDGSSEKDSIRYAFDDFYARGGFRSGVKRPNIKTIQGNTRHPICSCPSQHGEIIECEGQEGKSCVLTPSDLDHLGMVPRRRADMEGLEAKGLPRPLPPIIGD